MAITKLVSANTPNPLTAGAGGDWDLAMAQLTACKQLLTAKPMILTNWSTYTKPALAEGSYIQHLGSIYIVDTEDYELPTFSSDYSNYIKVTESGDTLAITIINSTSGYIWTPVYNGLYNGVHQLLPYRIDYILPSKNYYKYRFIDTDCKVYMDKNGNISTAGSVTIGGSINATGAISGATVNTGQGNNELYAMNQNVRTTDSPTFAGIAPSFLHMRDILSSFASPNTFPNGLAFNGTNLISCDSSTAMIYLHHGVSSSILGSFASPNTFPNGLAFDGINLISCDTSTDMIYIHNGVSSSILSSFSSPATSLTGLAFNGTNLISCSSTSGLIYIHNGISSSILSSFASPGGTPMGLAFDGINLISCDTSTDMIYIHNGVSSSILSSFASPNIFPTGLVFDGTHLISCDTSDDKIYIHRNQLAWIR